MKTAIHTTGLTKLYGATLALDHLDVEVESGEVFGFLGPNGAGKTTTIRLLLGLLRPTSGSARVLGMNAWHDAVRAHRRISYVPSDLSLWPSLTGAQTLAFLARLHGPADRGFRDELIERFQLDPSVRVGSYSRGNRQKIGVIAAFMTRPDLLIFDEPTSGLDPLMEVVFRDCVREAHLRGQTIFLSSHLLDEVEALCDRVAILRRGRLVDLASLAELRRLTAVRVEATFEGPVASLGRVPGVRALTVQGHRLRCEVVGPLPPVLAALSHAEVTDLVIEKASLEEVFLAHYGHAS